MSKYNANHPAQRARQQFADKRYWVFVLNNPESNDLPKGLKDLDEVSWQREIGSRGTPHLQGVAKFLFPKSWTQVRAMLPTAWWSVMLGTKEEAIAYCTKEFSRVAGPWHYMPLGPEVVLAMQAVKRITESIKSGSGAKPDAIPSGQE